MPNSVVASAKRAMPVSSSRVVSRFHLPVPCPYDEPQQAPCQPTIQVLTRLRYDSHPVEIVLIRDTPPPSSISPNTTKHSSSPTSTKKRRRPWPRAHAARASDRTLASHVSGEAGGKGGEEECCPMERREESRKERVKVSRSCTPVSRGSTGRAIPCTACRRCPVGRRPNAQCTPGQSQGESHEMSPALPGLR